MSDQKNPVVGWRMPLDIKQTVNTLAKQEQRSLANMIKVLVNEALKARNLKTEKEQITLE